MTTITTAAPVKFAVGETVGYVHGEDVSTVKVLAVKGNTVTVKRYGQEVKFAPRKSDGKYVKTNARGYEVMPDLLIPVSRIRPRNTKKPSLLRRLVQIFV